MKGYQLSKKLVALLFLAVWGFIVATVLITSEFVTHITEQEFLLSNFLLLLIGFACTALLCALGIWLYRRFPSCIERISSTKSIVCLSVLLFFFQVSLCYNTYFLTGWDAQVIFDSAVSLANGGEVQLWYFVRYPNNLFLTYLYALILKINSAVGIFTAEQGVFSLILFQCLLSSLTAYLTSRVTESLTKNKWIALFAFAVYVAFIGVSPWTFIPYSDATGLIFPIAIFRLWQLARGSSSGVKARLLYAAMGLVAFLGYNIKPQTVIMFIAILLIMGLELLLVKLREKQFLKTVSKIGCALLVFLFCTVAVPLAMPESANALRQSEEQFGLSHFLMMGLNEERQGIYADEDVDFSASFATVEERTDANIDKVKQRLQEMGFGGFMKHLSKKTLVNYDDGSFAWQIEGKFVRELPEEKNQLLSPYLRSFYLTDGENYSAFMTRSQCIWLTVLALGVLSVLFVFKNKDQRGDEMCVLLLALVGLFLFCSLFESRARYLFTHTPIFIICAVVGLYTLLKALRMKSKEK